MKESTDINSSQISSVNLKKAIQNINQSVDQFDQSFQKFLSPQSRQPVYNKNHNNIRRTAQMFSNNSRDNIRVNCSREQQQQFPSLKIFKNQRIQSNRFKRCQVRWDELGQNHGQGLNSIGDAHENTIANQMGRKQVVLPDIDSLRGKNNNNIKQSQTPFKSQDNNYSSSSPSPSRDNQSKLYKSYYPKNKPIRWTQRRTSAGDTMSSLFKGKLKQAGDGKKKKENYIMMRLLCKGTHEEKLQYMKYQQERKKLSLSGQQVAIYSPGIKLSQEYYQTNNQSPQIFSSRQDARQFKTHS